MTLFLSSHSPSQCMPYGRAVFLTLVRCSLSLAYSESSVARLSLHQQSHRTQCPESKSLTWNPFVLWLFSHCNEICVDEKISKVQSKDAKIAPKKRDIYKLNSEQRATKLWRVRKRREKKKKRKKYGEQKNFVYVCEMRSTAVSICSVCRAGFKRVVCEFVFVSYRVLWIQLFNLAI